MFLRNVLEQVFPDVGCKNLCPLPRQRNGRSPADALPRRSDQCDATLKLPGHGLIPSLWFKLLPNSNPWKLSMTNVDLAYASATELLKLFKARKASPVELLKVLIARSQKLNEEINSLADRYFDEAHAKEKTAEQPFAKR